MLSPNNQITNVNQGMPGYVSSNIIAIHGGREGALSYPIQLNYKALLIDEENKMAYVKFNNQILGEFSYEDITPQENKPLDSSKYATKDDFNMLMKEIKKLQGYNKKNVSHRYNNNNDFNKPRRNYSNG